MNNILSLTGLLFIVVGGVVNFSGAAVNPQENILPLAGNWRFRLGPENAGVAKRCFAEKLDVSVTLPGTTDTNQKAMRTIDVTKAKAPNLKP